LPSSCCQRSRATATVASSADPIKRFNSDIAGRPQSVHGNTQLLFGGMRRLQENAVINTKNHSHSVTTEVDVPAACAQGVIIAQGGDFGGWSLDALAAGGMMPAGVWL
jgi:hypothetical protein